MSIRYYNQTAPFWDFIANFEDHQTSRATTENERAAESGEEPQDNFGGPWGFPFMFGQRGGHYGHGRGRHHNGGPHHAHTPPPPPPPPYAGEPDENEDVQEGPSKEKENHPSPPGPPHHEGPHHGHGMHHGPGPHRGRCGGRGGRGAGRGRGGPFGRHGYQYMGPFSDLAEKFQSHFFGENDETRADKDETFKPEADVFDTSESFVVHVSLPGAKKEDVAVNWDAEKSELNIAGVVYRPGDEEFLKTLAMDERKVGMFERKIRLGSRANPAQVDVDGIGARMEDGVLRVTVPKLDSGYVEIKKVDID